MDNQETNATRISRPFYFGFIGLVGCLIGAILGELFLTLTKGKVVERPPRNEMDIVLLIDTSGSMRGNPLAEVQRAMQAVIPMVKPLDKLAIVSFDSDARIVQGLTNDGDQLRNCIDGLQAYGATFMSAGLEISRQILEETDWDKRQPCVLLFSDGAPTESTSHCVSLARTMRRKGIAMIAIGAYGANIRFLERLVGANNVINAVNGNILDAFRQAVQTLQGSHGFMEGNAGFDVSLGRRIFRAFGWSVLLSIGTILLLLMFQNRLMGNPILAPEQLGSSVGGGFACGFLSGVVTQFIFEVTTDNIDMIAYTIKSLCLLIAIVLGIVLFFQLKSNNRQASNSSGIGCLTFILMLVLMFIFREGGVFVTNGMFIFSVLSWAIWGWGITNIIGVIIPNFDRRRALWAGALGGAVASLGFLASSAIAGEISGRLIGSCFLGFAIGTLVGFLRGSKEGKQVTVYDTVTHEYVTTSNVG
ncbi:MAG: VWA domain-containing protein, partial [Victivallales bacterium]|nr:VWA domain-containing protein [Victivallales bacterium]